MASLAPKVRGRLAPSPTGHLHLGNAWAFLLAWLAARSADGGGGEVVLRMEDIDPDRSREHYARDIITDLKWLGLDWDEGPDLGGPCGPYTQSERLSAYAAALASLESSGHVYPCFCTRKELRSLAHAPHAGDGSPIYPGTCRLLSPAERSLRLAQGRAPCLRLTCPDESLSFTDLVAGPQSLSLTDCGGDFALRRSDGVFAYQLAVVLDDIAMNITQIVRGDDILTSTPRQLLLYRLLHSPPPSYAHLPLILDHEGERLAKRHSSLTLAALRDQGISPLAITGYLAHHAGLLPSPAPASPRDLLPHFDLARLPRQAVRLPMNIFEVLLRV